MIHDLRLNRYGTLSVPPIVVSESAAATHDVDLIISLKSLNARDVTTHVWGREICHGENRARKWESLAGGGEGVIQDWANA